MSLVVSGSVELGIDLRGHEISSVGQAEVGMLGGGELEPTESERRIVLAHEAAEVLARVANEQGERDLVLEDRAKPKTFSG